MSSFKYKAFISYSHQDESTARWLHRALETYRPPRVVQEGSPAPHSSTYPLRPIFRDQDELVASANLSASLVEALQQSEFLIVICSPSSAQSRWTSQEIIEFKKIHGPERVIAVIAEGDPATCFPQPLLQEVLPSGEIGDAVLEPLAADLQGARAERRLALLKVAATMLDLGLDQLVQREAHRRQRFLATVASAAFVGMLVMGWLTYTAVNERRAADAARQVAEQSQEMAEQRRQQAEDLIEFMLGDLRDKLEPVGRLEVLDSVGAKALDYYSSQDQSRLSPDSLGRRARALHLLGEISDMKGDSDAALQQFALAAETTSLLLQASPEDTSRIFDHAQSVFWVGLVAYHQGQYGKAQMHLQQYLHYARELVRLDPDDDAWSLELFYAYQSIGGLAVEQGHWESAESNLVQALSVLQAISNSDNRYYEEWPTIHSWLVNAYTQLLQFEQAERHSQLEVAAFHAWLEEDPGNYEARRQLIVAQRQAADLALIRGDLAEAAKILEPLEGALAQLVAHEPDDVITLQQSALLNQDLAELMLLAGKPIQAAEQAEVCIDKFGALLQRNADSWYWALNRDQCRYLVAAAAFGQRDYERALGWLEVYHRELLAGKYPQEGALELSTLVAETSLLLGDIAEIQSRHDEAVEYWRSGLSSLAEPLGNLSPRQIVVRIAAQQRLDNAESLPKMVAHLQDVGYQHPAFLLLLER